MGQECHKLSTYFRYKRGVFKPDRFTKILCLLYSYALQNINKYGWLKFFCRWFSETWWQRARCCYRHSSSKILDELHGQIWEIEYEVEAERLKAYTRNNQLVRYQSRRHCHIWKIPDSASRNFTDFFIQTQMKASHFFSFLATVLLFPNEQFSKYHIYSKCQCHQWTVLSVFR